MRKQIHKRLPKDFVKDVIRTFSEEKISREQASEFLGLSKAQLYRWRENILSLEKKERNSSSTIERLSLLVPLLQM